MSEMKPLWEDENENPNLDVTILQNFFKAEEANDIFNLLKEKVPWEQEILRMFGKEIPIPRLTAWFGDPEKTYTYSGILNQPHDWKLIPELDDMREKLSQACSVNFNRTGP